MDVDLFRTPQPRPAELPASPVAVYVGTLHEERVDVPLLLAVARSRPDLQVAVVGPDSLGPASHELLAAEPAVHLLGPVAYDRVPAFLQHADVVVIPHQVNPFTESLDPIKAYECLAAGRPTVSTPVAGFRDLGAPVVVADRDHFVAAVADVLDGGAGRPGGRRGRRSHLAAAGRSHGRRDGPGAQVTERIVTGSDPDRRTLALPGPVPSYPGCWPSPPKESVR